MSPGPSQEVQQRRLSASTAGAQVQSLLEELGSCVLRGTAKKLRVPMCIRGLPLISEPCGPSYDKIPGAEGRLHTLGSQFTVTGYCAATSSMFDEHKEPVPG